MKKIFTLVAAILMLCPTILAQTSPKKEKTHKTFAEIFKIQPTKKQIKAERDSLLIVNENLLAIIDSLMYENQPIELLGITTSEDSLNIGDNDIEANIDDYMNVSDTLPISTDSLLSLWYQNREFNYSSFDPSSIDTLNATTNIPDSVYISRLQKLNPYIAVPYNKSIRNHIVYYTEKMPDKMETILGLATYYMPVFEEIFNQYDLPLELTAMAVIESALNSKAVSRASAKGMWQFMYSTAKRYGLNINSYVDERFDPIASAHAAAKYLRDSYIIFGDWALAIASYNCGTGNVNKAIRRSGNSKDFWEIYPFLPRETRGYVPSFFAALYAMRYYPEHGLTPKTISMPPHTDTIQVNKMLHFEQIMHFTGITKEELRTHNPQYLHDIIPGTERTYILQLPYKYTGSFIDHEDSIYAYNKEKYFNPAALKKIEDGVSSEANRIVHKVRSGETLSHIAYRYGVSISRIKQWNNLRSNNIKIGQRIVIYKNGKAPASTSAASSSNVSTTTSKGYVMYTIRKGDNLWEIAKKFDGVTVNSLMKLNGLNKNSKLYPGNKIKIKKAE